MRHTTSADSSHGRGLQPLDPPLRGGAGGIVELRRLLTEHGGAIEADLHRVYGIRLNRALYGPPQDRYSPREILTRIRHLPPDSAFVCAVLGPERAAWSVNSYLLAGISNLLAGANWQRSGGKGLRPKPVQTPASKPQRQQRSRAECDDSVRRLVNLGLIPGQRHDRQLTPQEQQLAVALRRAQERKQEPTGG